MSYTVLMASLAAGTFIGMLILLELGRRIGLRRLTMDPDGARAGAGVVEGAVFALLGLLIAFTFSGAASRFDVRRQLIVEEANAIGTAYLRLDILPPAAQPVLREKFRQYVETRIAVYRKLPDLSAARAELAKSSTLQQEIWSEAVAASQAEGAQPARVLVLPALNAMIDITSTRTMATRMHPPMIIFAMLIGLALASSLLAGSGMAGGKARSWIHLIGFAATMALAVYVILDIEFPRIGLIQLEEFDQMLVDVRASMR